MNPRRRVAHVAVALCACIASPLLGRGGQSVAIYRQPSASIEQRVDDLVARMNAREKIAQITSHWIPEPTARVSTVAALTPEWMARTFGDGIGSIGPCQLGIDEEIAVRTTIQAFLRTQTRLGIPAFFHDELSHGLMKPEATSFPAPIGLASSWNEALVERLFDHAAREARARGTHHALTPVVDVTLDPRWGRTEETLGEDPFLTSRLGAAIVRGLQGGNTGRVGREHVMATLKHLVGHGASEGGLNRSPAHIGPVELRDTHLAPFAAIIRLARPAAIMPSYNEVDGIPSHANRTLLLDVVRRELGFTGLFVSDYDGIAQLHTGHRVVGSAVEAARLALASGVQMELPVPTTFSQLLPYVGRDPGLDAMIDHAVRAVLRSKFEMGLFEEPAPAPTRARALATSAASRQLALEAARESIVLLKNDGDLLPLVAGRHKRIAVIGPNADIARLGGYSGRPLQSVSLLDGVRTRVGAAAEVVHARGCHISSHDARDAYTNWRDVIDVAPADPADDQRLIAEAVALAAAADLVILALGENEAVSRESWATRKLGDRAALDLVGAQAELARRVLDTGTPVILYLSNGRPIALGDLADRVPVIIEGWYAGQETGRAAAEILFGDVAPSGKLAISIPRSAGHLPSHYRRKPYSAPFTYLFSTHEPHVPFGFGLSYTRFTYSNVRVSQTQVTPHDAVRVDVDVANTGRRAGVEIVQWYLHDEVSSVTRPVMTLRGFQRVPLRPGESRTVSVTIGPDDLAYYNRAHERVIEPGWFRVLVGGSSAHTLAARFEVK